MALNIGPKLVSKLGSPDSKIPLAIKDVFNSAGYTYFSYDAGGSVEGKDRLVDEAGTGAIWLFGIPLYKKIIDNTLYKVAKISPEVDVRVLQDNEYLNQAIKNAPTEEILKEIQTAANHPVATQALAIGKFALALGLTMLSYFGLTKLKQKMTKLNIEKEFNEKMQTNPQTGQTEEKKTADKTAETKVPEIFKEFENFGKDKTGKQNPSFGISTGLRLAEDVMINPVKNMVVLDMGITAQRLSNARTDGEFKEYAIKEGSFLFFVYCADKLIKKGLEVASQKLFKLPVALDAKFLSSDLAEKVLKNEELQNQVKEFGASFAKNTDTNKMYEFIFGNQNNAVVNAAKESGIISTVKDKAGEVKIDSRKYIDPNKMKKLVSDLQTYIESGKSASDIKNYLGKIRGLKVAATIISVGACCLSLGYIVPKLMYEYRKNHQNGNNDFHVRTEYEKELAAKSAKKEG